MKLLQCAKHSESLPKSASVKHRGSQWRSWYGVKSKDCKGKKNDIVFEGKSSR